MKFTKNYKVKTGKWIIHKHCIEYDKRLDHLIEYAYGDGCCPYCGHISGSTFCEVVPVAVRRVETFGSWWEFWYYESYYERKDGKPAA